MNPHNRIQLLQSSSIKLFNEFILWLTGLYSTPNVADSGTPEELKLVLGSNVAQSMEQMKSDDRWLEKHYRNVFSASQFAPAEQEKFQSIIDHLTGLKDEDTFKNAIHYCDGIQTMGFSKKFGQIVKYCVAAIFQLGGNDKESLNIRETIASQSAFSNKHSPILNDFQVADNLHQLAWLQFRLGKLTEAVQTFKETLNLKCIVYGMEDYLTLNTYKSLGQVFEKQGNTEDAYCIYRDALSIEKTIGRENLL